jgi:sporulation protein YabP
MQENTNKPSSLILDNRKKLSVTGVEDVVGFNDESVSLKTVKGDLLVSGSSLHISKLDLDTGNVELEGIINSLQYSREKNDKSFMQRLFS